MDGLEMTQQIRVDSEITHIPILVFTALSSLTLEDPLEAGANKIFYKPFDFNELRQIVREMLGQSNSE
jgi:CheY-like chemotaxis protein